MIFEKIGYGTEEFLVCESSEIPLIEAELKKGNEKYSYIYLNSYKGYEWDNIIWLLAYKDRIKGLVIVGEQIDIYGIDQFENLEVLVFSETNEYAIDFSVFSKLKECRITWSTKYKNLDQCLLLEVLSIRKFKSTTKSRNQLSKLYNLKELKFVQGNIKDLDFIAKLEKLEIFEGHYQTKLENIEALGSLKSLKRVVLYTCRKVLDYKALGSLVGLSYLMIAECSKMDSLEFIKEMKDLDFLSFYDTLVEDGDLSFCVGIKTVTFDDRKHYSHRCEEFN